MPVGAATGLLALLGGLLNGYQNGRQQLFAARADDADRKQRQISIDNQADQFTRSLGLQRDNLGLDRQRFGFEQAQAEDAKNRWGLDFDFRKAAQASDEAFRQQQAAQAVKEHADDLGIKMQLLPNQLGAGRLGLLSAAGPILQGGVGTSPENQQNIVAGVNSALAGTGVQPIPTPFAPTGETKPVLLPNGDPKTTYVPPQFEDAFAAAMTPGSGGPQPTLVRRTPTFTQSQEPVLRGGIEATPETAAQMAQTGYTKANTDRMDAEAQGLPLKYKSDYLRAKADGDYKAMQLVLQKYKIDSDSANAAANRAVSLRGQDMTATTAANGQKVTLFTAGQRMTTDQRKGAFTRIDQWTKSRDKELSDATAWEAAADRGKDAKGNNIDPAALRAAAQGARQRAGQYQEQINQSKVAAGVTTPEAINAQKQGIVLDAASNVPGVGAAVPYVFPRTSDGRFAPKKPAGKFTKSSAPSAARTIQRKDGSSLTVQTVP